MHTAGDQLMKQKGRGVRVVSRGITLNVGEISVAVQISVAPIVHRVIAS